MSIITGYGEWDGAIALKGHGHIVPHHRRIKSYELADWLDKHIDAGTLLSMMDLLKEKPAIVALLAEIEADDEEYARSHR